MMTALRVFNHYIVHGVFLLGLGSSVGCGSASVDPIDLQGQWQGEYEMVEVYDYKGDAGLKIDVAGDPQILTMEIMLKGELFADADTDHRIETLTGPYDATGTTVTGVSDLMGDMTMTIFPSGLLTGYAAPELFPNLSFVGDVSTEKIQIRISFFTFLSTDIIFLPEGSLSVDP